MLLIFYCGLVSSVVSVSFSNDTSIITSSIINGSLLVPNSTINPSSVNDADTDCVPQLKESEIMGIIVDIYLVSDASNSEMSLVDTKFVLANRIGREILYTLGINRYNFLTYTLNAGRTSFSLHVNASLEKCWKSKQKIPALCAYSRANRFSKGSCTKQRNLLYRKVSH